MEHANLKPEFNRKKNPGRPKAVIQAQLETTVPGDVWEQEADRAADIVTGRHGQKASVNQGGVPAISAYGGTPVAISSKMESQFNALQGGGMSMPDGLKSQMQQGFGRDFSDVRIHTGDESAQMNASLGSRAFTHGNDIYFNEGQYQPSTAEGQHLIAHELAHTIQQSGKVARSTIGPAPAQHNDDAEARGYMSDALGFIAALTEILVDSSYIRTAVRERKAMAEITNEAGKGIKKAMASFSSYDTAYKKAESAAAAAEKMAASPYTMDAGKIAATGGKALKVGFDFFSWAFQTYDWSMKSVDAVKAAQANRFDGPNTVNMCYTILRLATCVADFPIPLYPPHVLAVLKSWNTGCAIGDVINDIMKWTGVDELRVQEMMFTSGVYGGPDSTAGNVAAAITSVPVIGEVFAGATWLGDTIGGGLADLVYGD